MATYSFSSLSQADPSKLTPADNFLTGPAAGITASIGPSQTTLSSYGSSWALPNSILGGRDDQFLTSDGSKLVIDALGVANHETLSSRADQVLAGGGDDLFSLGFGDDKADGGYGADTLLGGEGNDTLVGGAGDDSLDGGPGADVAIFSGAASDYSVTNLGDGIVQVRDLRNGSPDGTDTLVNVETIQFSGAHAYNFSGLTQDQQVSFGPHDSIGSMPTARSLHLEFGPSVTLIATSNLSRFIVLNNASLTGRTDQFLSTDGSRLVVDMVGVDNTGTLTDHDDQVWSGMGDDSFVLGGGNDFADGGGGNDSLDGGLGNDTLVAGADTNLLLGGAGADSLIGGSGPDTLDGGDGADYLWGSAGANVLIGGTGNDILDSGGDGASSLSGGDDDDFLYARGGADTLDGGAGSDTLTGGAGADRFVFDSVADSSNSRPDLIVDFQHGVDKIDLHRIASGLTWGGATPTAHGVWYTISGSVTVIHIDTHTTYVGSDGTINLYGTNLGLTAADFVL